MFDQMIVAMLEVKAELSTSEYNAAVEKSVNTMIDSNGTIEKYILCNKIKAFCQNKETEAGDQDDEIRYPSFDEMDSDFFEARGLELVFPLGQDELVRGIAIAPGRAA